jgi:hypothetical protein
MLVLLIVLVVAFIIMAILLGAITLGIQGYIYSEPVANTSWRAPAAAAAIVGFLTLWSLLDYGAFDPALMEIPYDTIFRFNPRETRTLEKFWSVRNGQKILYTRQESKGRTEYVDSQGRPWERSDATGIMEAIVVDDRGQELRFEPNLVEKPNPSDPTGPKLKYFPQEKPGAPREPFPTYYQVGGRRKMLQLGVVSVFRWGLFFANLFLNALFFGVCFVTLWLILRFQWPHALGFGAILWLVLVLVAVPMLLAKTQELAQKQPASPGPATLLKQHSSRVIQSGGS